MPVAFPDVRTDGRHADRVGQAPTGHDEIECRRRGSAAPERIAAIAAATTGRLVIAGTIIGHAPDVTSTFIAPAADRASPPSPQATRLFASDDYERQASYFARRPELGATPLTRLPALAHALGLGAVRIKDETARFGLNAFKLLGARFAVEQLLERGDVAQGDVLVCASEGNHGRAVAHTARLLGCHARVYLADTVAQPRADAIAAEGADVIRVAGSYDDAVRRAAADAARHGWVVVSDTSWSGYEEIPRLIMLGYTRMVDEMVSAMPGEWRPDAIYVPGGVGGLLAAVALASFRRWPNRPRVICVEPTSAACLQQSARAGRPTVVPGPFTTMMGGLRCGEVSPIAFDALYPIVDAYLAVDDEWATRAVRMLARPAASDPALAVGPSGAAALAGLIVTCEDAAARDLAALLDLGPTSEVVLIASEGVTDPPLWKRLVDAR